MITQKKIKITMKTIFRTGFLLTIFTLFIFTSCKKNNDVIPNNNSNSQEDDLDAQEIESVSSEMDDIDGIIYDIDQESSNMRIYNSLCYSVEVRGDTSDPIPGFEENYRKYSLNFSGGDCDSLSRSGEVTVFKSGRYFLENYKDSVLFINYTSNGRTINGYKTLRVNEALTDDNYYVVDVTLSLEVKLIDGREILIQTIKQKKYDRPVFFSRVEISFTSQIRQDDGDIIIRETVEPLVLRSGWLWARRVPVQGVVLYKNTNSGRSFTIDFGDGTFDRRAVYTGPLGVSRTIWIL